jgi:DNA polymerase elongation subunit (family B)
MSSKFDTFIHNGLIPVYQEYQSKYLIAGDTDSAYIDLSDVFDKDADKKDVIEFADYIGQTTNDSFKHFMKDVFNVPDERTDIIQTDREVVSDKSYFLAKKMYVMHVIDQEGVEVDKLKMMGVSIKKTDTPVVVQDMLRELVDLLMDQTPYQEVKKFLDNFKEKYMKLPLIDIGKPIGVKSFAKYHNIFQNTGTMKNFPYHVRAALYYNSLCGNKDKTIVSNDKIRIIYIKHPKFKYIGLPVDVEEYPSFVDGLHVDWKAQWETVQKKIDIFLTPIGYDQKGRQSANLKGKLFYNSRGKKNGK